MFREVVSFLGQMFSENVMLLVCDWGVGVWSDGMCNQALCEHLQPQVEDIERTIRARDINIQEIKENMNNVEDVVFKRFCRDIGVANIRYTIPTLIYCI